MSPPLVLFCALSVAALLAGSSAATVGGSGNSATVGLYAPNRYEGIPDGCLLPMDFGYCRAKVKRYYFDMRRMKCNMFYWGGCAGNGNNFKSLDECNKVCLDAYYEDSELADGGQNGNSNSNTNNNVIANGRSGPAAASAKSTANSYLNKFSNRSDNKQGSNSSSSSSNNNSDNIYAASEDYDDEE